MGKQYLPDSEEFRAKYMTENQLFNEFGFSLVTQRRMRSKKFKEYNGEDKGLPYIRIGSKILYLRDDIETWLKNNKR